MSSWTTLGPRCVAVAFITLGAVPHAAADPVVYQNTSYIFGVAAVLQDNSPIETGNSFDTAGTPQPTTGAWSLSDTRTMNGLGAGATIVSSAGGTISPLRFTGTGTVLGLAFAPQGTDVTAQAWGRSVLNLSFELDQAYTFRYSGGYGAKVMPLRMTCAMPRHRSMPPKVTINGGIPM